MATATMIVLFTGVMLRGLTLANIDGSSPSRPIANRMRVWPYITTRVTEKIEITAPAARSVLAQVVPPVIIFQDHRQPRLGLFVGPELVGVLRAQSGERDQDVEAGDDDQCGDDRARHGLLRILDLVTGCGDRVEADEREEDRARGRGDAGQALVPEAGEVVGVERGERDDDEQSRAHRA